MHQCDVDELMVDLSVLSIEAVVVHTVGVVIKQAQEGLVSLRSARCISHRGSQYLH